MAEIASGARGDPLLAPAAVLTATLAAERRRLDRCLAARMSEMDGGPGGDPGALGWFDGLLGDDDGGDDAPRRRARRPPRGPRRTLEDGRRAALSSRVLARSGWLQGLAGYAVVVAVRSAHPGALAWSAEGRYLAGGVVAAAGARPAQRREAPWLARCATPGPKLRRARDGRPARGPRARRLLRGLLLEPDGGAVRAGDDEHRLDGAAHHPHHRRAVAASPVGSRRRRGRPAPRCSARPSPPYRTSPCWAAG